MQTEKTSLRFNKSEFWLPVDITKAVDVTDGFYCIMS
jgi:hypothetical protein